MSVATDVEREQRRTLPLLRALLEVAVVVVFALLIWNNFTLRRQQTRAAAAVKTSRAFAVKDQLGAIPATTLDGKKRDLDLRTSRGVVAVVNPTCESCRELVESTRGMPGVHVLSAASLEETRAHAKELGPNTLVLEKGTGGELGARLRIAPQLFVIDRGQIVRTCARIQECR
jgi:ABC-type cobalamin transport system ATPase subunit